MSISVSQLSRKYGEQTAVDRISFEVPKGQIVGFLGPNGAGKSTTMKMLTTYISPSSGTALVAGSDILESPLEVRKKVGYLPEHNPLYTEMYVREYLYFMAELSGLGKGLKKRCDELIIRTGLEAEQHKQIAALSKGYRQRVGLAQAMLQKPEVLILDEPTSGLDPNQVLEIRDLIKEFGSESTILLSTHIMQEVEAMCSRILIIRQGKLVADEPTSEIKNKFAGSRGIKVVFRDKASLPALQALQSIDKVVQVNEQEFEVYGKEEIKLREVLFQFAVDNNNLILEQNRIEQSLEDIFRKLTLT
jgi:ABC-2 type transport system ATP-binding protein